MTIPRLEAIAKHWETVPPLSASVAAIGAALGVTRQRAAPKAQNAQALFDMLGDMPGVVKTEKPEWLREAKKT
jgi:hypothetical protein